MKVYSDVEATTVKSIVDETIRLIDKSIACIKEEPENANALFNLGDSFIADIKSARRVINENSNLTNSEAEKLNDQLDAADKRREQSIAQNKALWRTSGKAPVSSVFGRGH